MEHIVVLVGSYHPNYSAVGVCAKNVVDELKKKAKVSVIACMTKYNEPFYEHFECCDLYRVSNATNSAYLYCSEKIGNDGKFKKVLFSNIRNLLRLLKYLRSICQKVNIQWGLVKAYEKKLSEINLKTPINTIVCFSFPFESVVSGIRFKDNKPEIRVIPFLMDRFASSTSLHRLNWNRKLKMKSHIRLEQSLFQHTDKILHLDSWKADVDNYPLEIKSKCILTEHPLLKPLKTENCIHYDNNKINIVYTGALIKNVRNPQFAISLFSRILEANKEIVLHFYIVGDCDIIIDKFASDFPGQVFNYGSVPLDVAHSAMINSNILFLIGNTDIEQVASKVFEYISAGKPIIHFSKNELDPVNKILSNYFHSYIVQENENNALGLVDIDSLLDFIVKNKNKKINFNDVGRIYPDALPAHSADLICADSE